MSWSTYMSRKATRDTSSELKVVSQNSTYAAHCNLTSVNRQTLSTIHKSPETKKRKKIIPTSPCLGRASAYKQMTLPLNFSGQTYTHSALSQFIQKARRQNKKNPKKCLEATALLEIAL